MSALEVGVLDSLAWRVDGEVQVRLHLPTAQLAGEVEVRFRDGERRVRRTGTARATIPGSMVEVAVPARRLAGGTWRIALRGVGSAQRYEQAATRLEARLLVHRGRPVALLPGRPPRTRMPEPDPRPAAAPSTRARARDRASDRARDRAIEVGRHLVLRALRRPPRVLAGLRRRVAGN